MDPSDSTKGAGFANVITADFSYTAHCLVHLNPKVRRMDHVRNVHVNCAQRERRNLSAITKM